MGFPARPRKSLSRPVRDAIRDRIIRPGVTILDYGCGRGDDVRILLSLGYDARGWDPYYGSQGAALPPEPASVVNFGYVLNVIENPIEREQALRQAYELAHEVLVVSAYVHNGVSTKAKTSPHSDGGINSRGVFQKLFYHRELGEFIESVLGLKPERADFGVYYVKKEGFQSPYVQNEPGLFGEDRVALLVEFAASHWRPIGRLLRREFSERQQALFKAHFSGYKALCEEAEGLLCQLDRPDELLSAYTQAQFGKRTREALYVHRSAIPFLSPLLKAVTGTAQVIALQCGEHPFELVKLSPSGKTVSFLDCESFETNDYPALRSSICVSRIERKAKLRVESAKNPSIYHRKELFVHPSHPSYDRFRLLTQADEANNLLSRPDIGRRLAWLAVKQKANSS